jgi:hypothetical protein
MLAGLPGPVPRPAIAQTGGAPPLPRLPGYACR